MRRVGKLAVIRIRSGIKAREEVRETLGLLGLTRVNHCTIIDDDPPHRGMLQAAKDFITWGEIKPEVLEHLLRKRGRLPGDRHLTDELVRAGTKFSSIGNLAAAICSGEAGPNALPGLKKVFRLHPPRKGYKTTKRPFRDFGALGYRGEGINELILRMS